MNRRRAGGNTVLFLLSVFGGALFFGCADPKGDFDAYVDRTNGIRGVVPETGPIGDDTGPGEDAMADTPPFDPKTEFSGTYLMSCLPNLATGDASKSLMFYGEVSSKGGKLTMKNYPLLNTATTLSKSETEGSPLGEPDAPIQSDATWVQNLGTVSVSGMVNRVSSNNLTIEGTVLHGRIVSTDRICGELDGQLTAPFMSSLNDPGDICVWLPLADGAPLPTVTLGAKTFTGFPASEYHCP